MRTSLLVLALMLTASVAPAADTPLRVARRIHVGGEGGWDYLTFDTGGRRLFVSHGTRVEVIDVVRDTIVGAITETPGVHGIALAPELNRGFTSNGRDSSVSIFNYHTLAPIARVKVPARNPDAITFDPASKRVFTFNGGSGNATAIDAATGTVVGSIALGGKPEFAAVDGAGKLFVNNEDSSLVTVVDTRSLAVLARWPLAPGEGPSGLALDTKRHRLFSVCGNKTCVVLDAVSGRVITSLPIGQGVDGVACDAERGRVYASNGEGTLTVIAEEQDDRYRVVETVTTERGARTVTLDTATGTVYVPTADYGPAPAPTAERPHPRPSIVPDTFRILAVGH